MQSAPSAEHRASSVIPVTGDPHAPLLPHGFHCNSTPRRRGTTRRADTGPDRAPRLGRRRAAAGAIRLQRSLERGPERGPQCGLCGCSAHHHRRRVRLCQLSRGSAGAAGRVRYLQDQQSTHIVLGCVARWITRFLSGNVRPRIHGGLGVVAFGASRTGLGLRVGAGLDVPVASRLAVVFDAAFAHTFLPSSAGAYPLARSYSYLPLRAGVSWR